MTNFIVFPLANSMFEDVWSRQAPPSVSPIERSNMVKKTIYSEASGIYLVQKLDKGNFLASLLFELYALAQITRNSFLWWFLLQHRDGSPKSIKMLGRLSRLCEHAHMLQTVIEEVPFLCDHMFDNANSQLWSQPICNEFLMLQCVAIPWNGHPMQVYRGFKGHCHLGRAAGTPCRPESLWRLWTPGQKHLRRWRWCCETGRWGQNYRTECTICGTFWCGI